MKKSGFLTLFSGAFLCIALFTSCENFLKAKEVQSQIEDSIAYANASVYTIAVTTEKSSGIVTKPAGGEAKVKPSDTFNLSFYAESDHQFIRWEVYNSVSNEKIENNLYLSIENPDMVETTCTLVKTPENSDIKPEIRVVAVERPQVYFTSPNYSDDGTPRNARIEVEFDKDISEDSIYYTNEEIVQLKKDGISDNKLLKIPETDIVYGYEKNGHKFYKNIQITSGNNAWFYEDPFDYYDYPYFESKRTLVINTRILPPVEQFGKLTITLDKGFFYLFEDKTPVTMRESKKWLYSIKERETEEPYFSQTASALRIYNSDSKQLWYAAITRNSLWVTDNNTAIQTCYNNSTDEQIAAALKQLVEDNTKSLNAPVNLENPNVPLNDKLIPKSSDSDYIRLGFNFSVIDKGGSNLKPYFYIVFYNPKDEDTPYYVQVPYYSRSENDKVCTGQANISEDIYWVNIPRDEQLSEKKIYYFTLDAQDNDGNWGNNMKEMGVNNTPISWYYWIDVTTPATTTP